MTKNEVLTRPMLKKVSKIPGKDNTYRAKCPAHDDAGRGLSLTFDEDDKLISAVCEAGCPTDNITIELFREPEDDEEAPKKKGAPTQAETLLDLVERSGVGFFRTDTGIPLR